MPRNRYSDYTTCPRCTNRKRQVAALCRPCEQAEHRMRTFIKARQENTYIGIGRQRQHRLIAEWLLGRPLDRLEVVHHHNELKWDNRPENIGVMHTGDHTRLHSLQRSRRA